MPHRVAAYQDSIPKRPPHRRSRQNRNRHERYLRLLRQLTCLACETTVGIEAAHIRMSDARFTPAPTGMGVKPDDWRALPLCETCHRNGPDAQHSKAEAAFWASHGVDPLPFAERLYAAFSQARDDTEALEAMEAIIRDWRLKK